MKIDVDYLLEGLDEYFDKSDDRIKEKIKQLKEDGFNFGLLLAIVTDGVYIIEKLASDADAIIEDGAKRKALVKFADDIIKLPVYFEWADNFVIGGMIDGLVDLYNSKHGKSWINKVSSIL